MGDWAKRRTGEIDLRTCGVPGFDLRFDPSAAAACIPPSPTRPLRRFAHSQSSVSMNSSYSLNSCELLSQQAIRCYP
jgi:hypothetical protein